VVILRASERCAVPWKNGGGVTREVIVEPAGSDFESFDWRVSLAEVKSAGPFSAFPGIERHMAVLSGELELIIGGRALTLTSDSAPLSFAGEQAVEAKPRAGAVTDLNLMCRRERCTGRLTTHVLTKPQRLRADSGRVLIVALTPLTLGGEDAPGTMLAPGDAALPDVAAEYELHPASGAQVGRYYRADIVSRTAA
jgi:uncharacterized protein